MDCVANELNYSDIWGLLRTFCACESWSNDRQCLSQEEAVQYNAERTGRLLTVSSGTGNCGVVQSEQPCKYAKS